MNTTRRDNLIFLKNSTNIKMNKRTNTFIATIISKDSKGNPLSYKMGKIITYLLMVLLFRVEQTRMRAKRASEFRAVEASAASETAQRNEYIRNTGDSFSPCFAYFKKLF